MPGIVGRGHQGGLRESCTGGKDEGGEAGLAGQQVQWFSPRWRSGRGVEGDSRGSQGEKLSPHPVLCFTHGPPPFGVGQELAGKHEIQTPSPQAT